MTIGQTSIKLSTILEHALRRVGIPAEAQTPEIVDTAKNNLFFILTNYANKGMNYWCVEQQFLTLVQGQLRNTLPDGTTDILNANYRKLTTTTGTVADATTSTSIIRQFSAATKTLMFKLDSSFSGTVIIATSTAGVSYTTHSTITHDGTSKWYSVDPTIEDVYLKLSVASGTFTVTELVTVSAYTDIPLYRSNRDNYSNLPNKQTQDHPLQFWLDRQVSPVMVLWPAPSSASTDNCIQYYRSHQISDIGALTAELDLPVRWYEATIWGLAQNLAFELPGVSPERVTLCSNMAMQTLNDAQCEERDNSPISLSPNIGVYTA